MHTEKHFAILQDDIKISAVNSFLKKFLSDSGGNNRRQPATACASTTNPSAWQVSHRHFILLCSTGFSRFTSGADISGPPLQKGLSHPATTPTEPLAMCRAEHSSAGTQIIVPPYKLWCPLVPQQEQIPGTTTAFRQALDYITIS